jgi:5-formyltetrahydrofolate cyclo-ligase
MSDTHETPGAPVSDPSVKGADIAARKAAARRAMTAARATAAAAAPAAAEAVRDRFLDGVDLAPGARVAGYWPMGDELDPRPLLLALAKRGHPVCLPVVARTAQPLVFRAWAPGDPLVAARFGTQVPAESATEVVPDLLLVPLLGFDRRGYRVGYGGGFYDRTLQALRAVGRVRAVGLAYAGQEAEAVPTEPVDQPLDALVTEREIVVPDPGPSAGPDREGES